MIVHKSELIRTFNLAKPRRGKYVQGLLYASLLDASVPIAMALLLKVVLNAITENNMSTIMSVSMIFVVIIIGFMTLIPIFHYWFRKTVNQIMADIRLKVFRQLENLPIAYYEKNHSGDSISRLNNDVAVIESAFSGNIRQLVTSVITGVVSAIVMFYLDWRFASVMILLGILSTFVNIRFAKPIRRISTHIQVLAGKQLERLSDLVTGTKISRMYQMKDEVSRKYKEVNDESTRLMLKREVKLSTLNSTNYFLLWINNGGMFIIGGLMIVNGQLTLGTLIALILLLVEVNNLFQYTGNMWANLQTSLAGSSRVFELLDYEQEPDRYPVTTEEHAFERTDSIIEIHNGTFGYTENEKIIEGLNVKVEKGQLVALVGPSGSGKSTIVKLLLGFYPLQQGEILIEGRSFGNTSLSEIRDKMAYVSQDAYLLEGTIEENIRYGREDATFEEIVKAARAAYAHELIMEQPDAYNTIVGERGTNLSGGQKQRIAIARALLKNAPILLLDEATSALDSESEQAVQKGIESLMKDKTTIAIAHRLSTIKQADVIYMINQGKIVEQGIHEQLIDLDGVYAQLYNSQMIGQ